MLKKGLLIASLRLYAALPNCLLCGDLFNCTDLIDRLLYKMKTKEDIYIFRGLQFIVKSAYQVRTVQLNCRTTDQTTPLWHMLTS